MLAIKLIFWLSGFLIFYSYIGYPLALWLLSCVRGKGVEGRGEFNPKVSLLISAYNESAVIEKKIVNSLDLNYPKDLLEIVVVSDGSTDGTKEIVERYAEEGVILRHYEGRIGKTACLNRAVPLAKGEIVLFSDANSKYDSNVVINLVSRFSDPDIGFVTGSTKYISKSGDESVGVYSSMEKLTKSLESKIGSCVGADGAVFAIRKDLYRPLRDFDINDFVIPLNVIKQGFRGVQDSHAFCIEDTAGNGNGEFKRQVRITNRTIRAIFNNLALLNPFKFGLFSFELFSHKLCKFLVPFFMMFLFVTNIFLISSANFYVVVFIMQTLFYLTAWIRHMAENSEKFSRFFSISYIFTAVNLAIFMGWIKYLQGETYVTWSPTQR